MRLTLALCLENTQGPTVPVVAIRVQVMTGYRKDSMSLLRFGVLRYSWFRPNAESSVISVVWCGVVAETVPWARGNHQLCDPYMLYIADL
jgi:hypothetical protein